MSIAGTSAAPEIPGRLFAELAKNQISVLMVAQVKKADDFWLEFWDLSGAEVCNQYTFSLLHFQFRFFSPKDA